MKEVLDRKPQPSEVFIFQFNVIAKRLKKIENFFTKIDCPY